MRWHIHALPVARDWYVVGWPFDHEYRWKWWAAAEAWWYTMRTGVKTVVRQY